MVELRGVPLKRSYILQNLTFSLLDNGFSLLSDEDFFTSDNATSPEISDMKENILLDLCNEQHSYVGPGSVSYDLR